MASRESFRFGRTYATFVTTDAHDLCESISAMTRLGWVVVSLLITTPRKWWHWRGWEYRYEVQFHKPEESVTDSLHFNFGPVSERVITQEPGPHGERKHVSID